MSDICFYYSEPQVTTSGEFRTGPFYVPTTFVAQMLGLRAVHIYTAHGNSNPQWKPVSSVCSLSPARCSSVTHCISTVQTIKYDMGTQ